MKFVNVRDLKDHASAILRGVRRGDAVVVTNWGKPQAALVPLTEDGLEAFILKRNGRAAQESRPYRRRRTRKRNGG